MNTRSTYDAVAGQYATKFLEECRKKPSEHDPIPGVEFASRRAYFRAVKPNV